MRGSRSRDLRVLVTGGDHTGPLAAVRALGAAGYEPWVAVSGPRAYAARSRAAAGLIFVPESATDPEGFVETVRSAAHDHGLTAILSGTERDLIAIARFRDRLGPLGTGIPELSTALRITSKSTVNQLAAEAGMTTPPTIEVDREALESGNGLCTPLVVKPLRSETQTNAGGYVHGEARRVNTQPELSRLAPELSGERWLVQPCIDGQLGAICGVAWQGAVVCAVHQRAKRIWPADIGISAYAHTVPADRSLQDSVARLMQAVNWSGIFQVQFLHTEDASYLIDLNPRIYGSLALATAAGANLPAIWVALLTGREAKAVHYRVGVHYRAEEQDVRALLHLLKTRRPAAALLGLIPRRDTAHAVAELADPLPALTSLAKLRRRPTRSS
ncbi:MAG: ATP-grasp domain-containing protein [Solirubrobacteraceae bacterium]